MAIQINVGRISKRRNSTLAPTISTGVSLSANMKHDTSIVSPVFIVQTDRAIETMNYCIVPFWGRCYYISDVVCTAYQRYEIRCESDPLATFKASIKTHTGYIIRAEYETVNDDFSDPAYPPISVAHNTRVQLENFSFSGALSASSGEFVMGLINNSGHGSGAVCYYVMTPAKMRDFMADMLGSQSSMIRNITDFEPNTIKALVNPFQYIASCIWIPIEPTSTTYAEAMKFGWWDLSRFETVDIISNSAPYKILQETINIPQHPQAATRGKWLNAFPFTRLILNAGPFGAVEIDSTKLINMNQINIHLSIDCMNGVGRLTLTARNSTSGEQTNIFTRTAQFGVNVQLAQINNNIIQGNANGAAQISTGLASLAAQNPVAGIGNILNGVNSVIQGALPTMQTNGSNGSLSMFTSWYIDAQHFEIPDENPDIGKPYYKYTSINAAGLTGFVQFAEGDIAALGATAEETEQINRYMETGFFYE